MLGERHFTATCENVHEVRRGGSGHNAPEIMIRGVERLGRIEFIQPPSRAPFATRTLFFSTTISPSILPSLQGILHIILERGAVGYSRRKPVTFAVRQAHPPCVIRPSTAPVIPPLPGRSEGSQAGESSSLTIGMSILCWLGPYRPLLTSLCFILTAG
jgi:hypothetical protein